ncbi:MAG TPA: NAD(P)H-dependent oxidoreductase subunit E [Acidimicrobiales bacterium]|nr:NAD(P)H-dependent oxidoreductase subunit E [Acidimicrobiales bacterium]
MARLTPHNEARARDLIALYPHHRSALLPILHVLQEQDGYLTDDGMEHVGELLGLSAAEVRGTATFYDMFHVEPVGKYVVAVCTNIACMLSGAYELLESIEEALGVAPGGTTADGMFTLEDAECIALCGNAPCLAVNWRYFGDVTPEGFRELAAALRAGELDDEVPAHGTLSRVQRTVGLMAQGQSVHGAGGPPLPPGGADVAPQGLATAGPQPVTPRAAGELRAPAEPATADQGVFLGTRRTTTAVVALDGGRGLDASGTRTGGRPTPSTDGSDR